MIAYAKSIIVLTAILIRAFKGVFIEVDASKIRGRILHALWLAGEPMQLNDIAEKISLNSSSTMGYLLGLIKAKYVAVPKKHNYAITPLGKHALGFPTMTREQAFTILRSLPVEQAFHFHDGINQYLGVYATHLRDFAKKIQAIDLKSIEFHLPRKDFELWIDGLGDTELSKKIAQIRHSGSSGEVLRKEVIETVQSRCKELDRFALRE